LRKTREPRIPEEIPDLTVESVKEIKTAMIQAMGCPAAASRKITVFRSFSRSLP
jgi:hypothetical protein